MSCSAACYQAGSVNENCTRVRYFNVGPICNGFEQAEEGDLVGGKTGISWRGGTDPRYVDGAACEGGEHEAMGKGFVACEAERRLGD